MSEDGLSADLELCFSVPEMYVTTKGLDDPWDEDLSDWLVWYRLTDGREIYQMTLMLIEESTGDLVAFRDFYKDSGYNDDKNGNGNVDRATEYKAAFYYDDPQGGRKSEKLVRGKYMLIAIANYKDYTLSGVESIDYEGLYGAVGNSWEEKLLKNYIADIETEFLNTADGKEVGIKGFMDVSGNGNHSDLFKNLWLFNIVLAQDTDDDGLLDNVGKKQPQPLTLVKHLELHPGLNKFDCQLERTYVRVRVEIENNSGTNDLSVYDLKFCDWFTQRAAYLLNDPDSDRNYDLTFATGLGARKGAPDLNTDDAIVKFTGTESAPVTIAKQNSKVIYDGYVFGSRLGKNPVTGIDSTYSYTLNLEYKGVEVVRSIAVTETPITKVDDFSDKTYLIQPVARSNTTFVYENENKQLYSNGNLAYVKSILDANGLPYVWKMIKVDDIENAYYIQNMDSEHYVGKPNGRNVPCNIVETSQPYFIFSDMDEYSAMRIAFSESDTGYTEYWNEFNFSNPDYGTAIGWWYNLDDVGAPYRLYPVTINKGSAVFNDQITLEIIDPETAHVSPVHNIKRNDFLNIVVSVSYNARKGDFAINSVLDWDKSNNEIEFH